MRRVFVDSGAFFANVVVEDAAHSAVEAVFSQAIRERWEFFTSNAVAYEAHALFVNRARNGRQLGLAFLRQIRGGFCRVLRVTQADERRAIQLLEKHADKDYSFTDALSFMVMERLRISDALAVDGHFKAYGRLVVLPA
jgi:predicted nucleic acid-binding protein